MPERSVVREMSRVASALGETSASRTPRPPPPRFVTMTRPALLLSSERVRLQFSCGKLMPRMRPLWIPTILARLICVPKFHFKEFAIRCPRGSTVWIFTTFYYFLLLVYYLLLLF